MKNNEKLTIVKKNPQPKTEPDYTRGYTKGFDTGFELGVKKVPDLENERKLAYLEGVKHIATLAEGFLIQELKLPDRDALSKCGKIPAWWILTLVTNFCEKENK